jgi:S-adenosylmethionine:tRNA ribosyltransferase-isomerase
MSPATWPRPLPEEERLLVIDPTADGYEDARVGDLPQLLRAGDLLVVNDAATLPGSLAGTAPDGAVVEVRLVAAGAGEEWSAVLFGIGDWRMRTEDRPAPELLHGGDEIRFEGGFAARVTAVSALSSRLVTLCFNRSGAALWRALYRQGRPVQYAYLRAPLELWHAQNHYAGRPWAVELPSAGRPLTWTLLEELEHHGVHLARLTHAAGLSSTGDAALDALLPLPERFEVPEETVAAVRRTRARGDRVVAVGTTVVRALEGAFASCGALRAGSGVTDLRIRPGFRPQVVDGLLTGLHEPTASHFDVLQAFAPRSLLERAYAHAEQGGYLGHEFGDSSLILGGVARAEI